MALCGIAAIFALVLVLSRSASAGVGSICPRGSSPFPRLPSGRSRSTPTISGRRRSRSAPSPRSPRSRLVAFGSARAGRDGEGLPDRIVPLALIYDEAMARGRRGTGLTRFRRGDRRCLAPFAIASPGGLWDSFDAPGGSAGYRSRASARRSCSLRTGSAPTTRSSSTGRPAQRRATSPAPCRTRSRRQHARPARGRGGRVAALCPPPRIRACSRLQFGRRHLAFLAFSRFVSPQYLVWLIPLVLVVPGRLGSLAAVSARLSARPRAALVLPLPRRLGPRRIVWLVVAGT